MKATETEARVRVGTAAVVKAAGSDFAFEEREFAEPRGREVLLKLHACGICHSDSFAFSGQFPGLKYPIIPGHEIVGVVEAIGPEARRLTKGDRVGVGWYGGHCGYCQNCRRGDFLMCTRLETPGITRDGGYSHYAVFPEEACAAVPDKLDSADAAPLMCAGVTTFNALRHSVARPGDLVAILGVGGLGHLGVQFAAKMGFHTVAIARGDDKAEFATKLGAAEYINSQTQNVAEALNKMGGAKVVLSTVTDSKAMSAVVEGLGVDGTLLIVGAGMEHLDAAPVQLLGRRREIKGWASGTAIDSEDCLNFAALTGVRPMIERFPFTKAAEAYAHMISGKARFRAVLDFGK